MSLATKTYRLPLERTHLKHVPAIPIMLEDLPATLFHLLWRQCEILQATCQLSEIYTIQGITASAADFLYGRSGLLYLMEAREELEALVGRPEYALKSLHEIAFGQPTRPAPAAAPDPLTTLHLEQPEQFAIAWTNYQDVYTRSCHLLPTFASSLRDVEGQVDEANMQFWPTIAQYGLGYNLLILRKVEPSQIAGLKGSFEAVWTQDLEDLAAKGHLYAIDMSIFEKVEAPAGQDPVRFTPGTITLLEQHAESKALTPVAIRVAGYGGRDVQVYTRARATSSAWLYALQAAKTSITVYGIWLGHVYHWHIVTAAMQMTMHNTLSDQHCVRQLLAPQSKYLMAFDDILLLCWNTIAPPTSISSAAQFLELINLFAADRGFFDDDPKATLARLGLQQADFTVDEPWDRYPIVRHLLRIWDDTERYIAAFVADKYADDNAVAGDQQLRQWVADSASPSGGNIKGLPAQLDKASLTQLLTSLVYRVTVHGVSRLNCSANPALTFVANFPPCLQDTTIPAPDSTFDTRRLLRFLPTTGTIGKMTTFYFTFVFSAPYEPFIPASGMDTMLFFGPDAQDPCNQALIRYREAIRQFIEDYERDSPQLQQWPLSIET